MSEVTQVQLEEQIGQLEADLSAVTGELEALQGSFMKDLSEAKVALALEAAAADAERQEQMNVALKDYEALYDKANIILAEQKATDPALLGVAGRCAREGIISALEGIFGDV